MANYEEWREMNAETIAVRVRNLKSSTIAALIEGIIIMLDSGHYPKEVFQEVKWVQKLLWDLKAENTIIAEEEENETYN